MMLKYLIIGKCILKLKLLVLGVCDDFVLGMCDSDVRWCKSIEIEIIGITVY